ncbi:hypothetical protein [Avrilella dinanensis]|uniref:Uncharacterized protein n=1 Tax=Avrilella dinanensis TaxID=2008672 RepID=A0A2M9R7D5_9FLAO|nr:hypothetical protein [Avrilella dinanensis]PJR04778.1 hypothetical protein CDL10_09665 [Avrilella dinanensis]
MKLYKPLFSIIIILTQLILSLTDYYNYIKWEKDNLNSLICRPFHGDSLFCFVLIIGLYEMLTKPGGFKKIIRILLIVTLLGTQFSYLIPINDFYFGVYNTAWFSAIIALILITVKFLKAIIKTKKRNYPKIISF